VCNVRKPSDHRDKTTTGGQQIGSLQEVDNSNSDDSGSDNADYLHNLLQLGTRTSKFLLTVDINSEMEIGSGAEHSTTPLSVFEQQLADVCELQPSSLSLFQYDKSPLTIAGECQANIKINSWVFSATFVVVDVQKQFPLLGRDWMVLLNFDVVSLMTTATAVHQMSTDAVMNKLIQNL